MVEAAVGVEHNNADTDAFCSSSSIGTRNGTSAGGDSVHHSDNEAEVSSVASRWAATGGEKGQLNRSRRRRKVLSRRRAGRVRAVVAWKNWSRKVMASTIKAATGLRKGRKKRSSGTRVERKILRASVPAGGCDAPLREPPADLDRARLRSERSAGRGAAPSGGDNAQS